MCVLMCLYIHVAVKGEPQMAFLLRSIHFLVLLVCFLRQDLTEEDRLSGQPGSGIHLSPAPQDTSLPSFKQTWDLGIRLSFHYSLISSVLLFCYVFHSLIFISMDNAFQNTPTRITNNCYENYFYFCYCTLIS